MQSKGAYYFALLLLSSVQAQITVPSVGLIQPSATAPQPGETPIQYPLVTGSFNGTHLQFNVYANDETVPSQDDGGPWYLSSLEFKPENTKWNGIPPAAQFIIGGDAILTEGFPEYDSSVTDEGVGIIELKDLLDLDSSIVVYGTFYAGITEEDWNTTTEYTARIFGNFRGNESDIEENLSIYDYDPVTVTIDWSKYNEDGSPKDETDTPDPEGPGSGDGGVLPAVYSLGYFNGTHLIWEAYLSNNTWVPESEGTDWQFSFFKYSPVDTQWIANPPYALITYQGEDVTSDFTIESSIDKADLQSGILSVSELSPDYFLNGTFANGVTEEDWNKTTEFTAKIVAVFVKTENEGTPEIDTESYVADFGEITIYVDWNNYQDEENPVEPGGPTDIIEPPFSNKTTSTTNTHQDTTSSTPTEGTTSGNPQPTGSVLPPGSITSSQAGETSTSVLQGMASMHKINFDTLIAILISSMFCFL